MKVDGYPAFCEGCEFAGDIPVNTALQKGSNVTFPETNYCAAYFVDTELRFSAGIVSVSHPENELTPEDGQNTGNIIVGCKRKGDECKLNQEGFVPVELDSRMKRKLVASYLNILSGVKLLGHIEFSE